MMYSEFFNLYHTQNLNGHTLYFDTNGEQYVVRDNYENHYFNDELKASEFYNDLVRKYILLTIA